MFIADNSPLFYGWLEGVYMANTVDELVSLWLEDGMEMHELYIFDMDKKKVYTVATTHKLKPYIKGEDKE